MASEPGGPDHQAFEIAGAEKPRGRRPGLWRSETGARSEKQSSLIRYNQAQSQVAILRL